MTRMIGDGLIHGWQRSRDDSLVYFESLEDSKLRGTGRTEEPDGSDVLRIEGPVPPPPRIVGAGVRGTGTRAGRGRGRSHDSSLRKAPFISTVNGEPRALLLPLPPYSSRSINSTLITLTWKTCRPFLTIYVLLLTLLTNGTRGREIPRHISGINYIPKNSRWTPF